MVKNNRENIIEWIKNDEVVSCTLSQPSLVNKIKNLVKRYPDECKIISDDGKSIIAHIPRSAIKINIRKMTLTDEERAERRKRILGARLKDE